MWPINYWIIYIKIKLWRYDGADNLKWKQIKLSSINDWYCERRKLKMINIWIYLQSIIVRKKIILLKSRNNPCLWDSQQQYHIFFKSPCNFIKPIMISLQHIHNLPTFRPNPIILPIRCIKSLNLRSYIRTCLISIHLFHFLITNIIWI